ncbi:MAG: TonB family protein [Nitrospirota bacterium]
MIAAGPQCPGGQKEAHTQGWLISALLHGTLAFAAILLVKQVPLAPQDNAFKWNVAMVSSAQPVQPSVSSPTQAPTQSVRSTTSAPSPRMQQPAPTQTLSSTRSLASKTNPSISERTTTTVVTAPPPPQLTAPSPSAAHTIQPPDPIRHETAIPIVSETASVVKPDETPMEGPSSADIGTAPSSAQSAILEQTTQSEQASAQTQVADISPALSNVPAKRDYGWLSEAILRRMEKLKRYPASARVDRAEGKVVVKALIDEDGSISEVEIFQSSGHITLDEAAIETMRQAAPIHLPHPLGQPRMTIKIPMSYRLDR